MGVCASCFGFDSDSDGRAAERERLLAEEDPFTIGGRQPRFNRAPRPVPAALTEEEEERQQEAHDRYQRWASDQTVDIFSQAAQAHGDPSPRVIVRKKRQQIDGANDRDEDEEARALETSQVTLPTIASDGSVANLGWNGRAHQDILLSMIPGDKSKRSIRIYPPSRPATAINEKNEQAEKLKGKVAQMKNTGSLRQRDGSGIFVKLEIAHNE